MNFLSRNIPTLAILCAWAGAATAAPLTFNTALPISKDEWILREQFGFMKNTDDPSPMNRRMEVSGLMTMLGYGVTRDFAVFGVLPYFDKRLETNMGGSNATRSRAGFGDVMLMGRYTVFEDNGSDYTFRIAPFLGVKAPTGSDHARDRLGRLPPQLQLGSGSWDWQGGVVGAITEFGKNRTLRHFQCPVEAYPNLASGLRLRSVRLGFVSAFPDACAATSMASA